MKKRRYAEIDLLRGVAVVGMISYHIAFDLDVVGMVELESGTGWWEILAEITAAVFFGLVGISMYISFSRAARERSDGSGLAGKYLLRGAKLVVWGLVITIVTYLLYPKVAILFGALHFIGASVVLSYLLLGLTNDLGTGFRLLSLAVVSATIFYLSGPLQGVRVDTSFLLWLGIPPSGFQSLDYFPLIPWFGFVAAGLVLGELFYPGGERRYERLRFSWGPGELLGRHSLVVYFLHQPLLYLGIFLFNLFSPGNSILSLAPLQ